jgi:hypothetical protein
MDLNRMNNQRNPIHIHIHIQIHIHIDSQKQKMDSEIFSESGAEQMKKGKTAKDKEKKNC